MPDPLKLAAVIGQSQTPLHPFQQPLQELAASLSLPLFDSVADVPDDTAWYLTYERRRLSIVERGPHAAGPTFVDFTPEGGLVMPRRRETLAVAIGVQASCSTVFDATAGFGRDTFMFALLGLTVTACERHPIVAALLADGLGRAAMCGLGSIEEAAARISLEVADAKLVLERMAPANLPDVVYLDPMFQPRRRKVAVNKRMRVSRLLVGADDDGADLMPAALGKARRRVVVKRHPAAPALCVGVSHEHVSKMARYDVYTVNVGI
ncbi:MAG: class I SAM-dependent methyltransferase [Phycisphaerae bacterium]